MGSSLLILVVEHESMFYRRENSFFFLSLGENGIYIYIYTLYFLKERKCEYQELQNN